MPRSPERLKQLRGDRLILRESLEEELVSLQAHEEDDGHDQRENEYDRGNETVWNASKQRGFWNRPKHGGS